MDEHDVESSNGLHKGLPGLQELLCRTHGKALEGDGFASLPERVPTHASCRSGRFAQAVASAAADLCEFHERPLSRGRAA